MRRFHCSASVVLILSAIGARAAAREKSAESPWDVKALKAAVVKPAWGETVG